MIMATAERSIKRTAVYALELLAPLVPIVREALAQFSKGAHQLRRLREGCLAILWATT
jgi:hypothetical protein